MEIKQHLMDALELVAVPLFLFNRNNQIIYLNKQAKEEIQEDKAKSIYLQVEEDNGLTDNLQQFKSIFNNIGFADNLQCVIKTSDTCWIISGSARYLIDQDLILYTAKNIEQVTGDHPLKLAQYPPQIKIELCKSIVEKIPSEIYFLNDEGYILFSNPYANSILKTKYADNKISHIHDINPAATIKWWKNISSQLKTKEYITFETKHQYSEGEIYPMMVNLFFVEYNNQTLYCYQSNDIANQYSIEKSLIKESKFNKNLAELSTELAKKQRLESVQLLVRQYALEITNSTFAFITYHDPEIQKLRFSIYNDTGANYNDEVKKIEKYITEQYHSEKNYPIEFIINSSSNFQIDGVSIKELIPFDNMLITGIFSSNELMGLLLVAGQESEYTESDAEILNSLANLFAVAINRTKESNKLSESLEQLELAMDVANMTIFEVNTSKGHLSINRNWQKKMWQLYVNNKHLYIKDLIRLMHPEDYVALTRTIKEHRYSNSSSFKINIRIRAKDESFRWFMTTGKIVSLSESGVVDRFMGVAMDITDMVHLNEQILQSREVAVEANKAKSAFLARISHEFRTPLNAIIGFADLLIGNSTNSMQLDYLNSIKKSGINLLNLINDILDYSKIEAGKMTLHLTPVNIIDLAKETCELFTQVVDEKQLKLITNFQEGIPLSILLDQVQIRQILTNLIANAVKFTNIGSVKFTIKSVKTGKKEVSLIFIVEDTGIGIRKEAREKIFEDFSQQGDLDNRQYGGTGLGLGIVRSLVKLMNGDINLESTPNIGSTFTVTIPNLTIHDRKLIHNPEDENNKNKVIDQAKTKDLKTNYLIFSESEKKLWIDFKIKPSFKKVPIIAQTLRSIKNSEYKSILEDTAYKLEKTIQSFDVEELSKTIQEFEILLKK